MSDSHHYLVFGDLHGRILPAFRLAIAYARDHDTHIDGILQVGDMGYFPVMSRLDKATRRHAEKDPLELGAIDVVQPSKRADNIFAEPEVPDVLWCTLGNHEDYVEVERFSHGGNDTDFPLDAYLKVRCVRDGCVAILPSGLRVGALWGVDGKSPNSRRKLPQRAYIKERSANQLAGQQMDVLLTHDSPSDAIYQHSGSEDIDLVLHLAEPAFHFFGHYHSNLRRIEGDYGVSEVYLMNGFEMRGRGGITEEGCVGLLTWSEEGGSFEYLDPYWLCTFTRQNWQHR